MQLRLFASFIIFIGSYFPLSLILLAQDVDYDRLLEGSGELYLGLGCSAVLKNPHFSVSIVIFCFICFVVTIGRIEARQA